MIKQYDAIHYFQYNYSTKFFFKDCINPYFINSNSDRTDILILQYSMLNKKLKLYFIVFLFYFIQIFKLKIIL